MDKFTDEGSRDTNVTFLLGAGRSGTTLLYKLLSLHPGIAYISNYANRLGGLQLGWLPGLAGVSTPLKLSAWFDRGNAYLVRRSLLKKLVPSPVEGEALYAACGLPSTSSDERATAESVRTCLMQRFSQIRKQAGAKIFLTKRTANNRRIPFLNRIFPTARYIHLVRDGRDVAYSLSRVEWWPDHVLYWEGRRAAEVERSGQSRIILCARNWVHEIEDLEKGLAQIDKQRIHELRYENLLRDPLGQLGSILQFLDLPMTVDYRQAIESLNLSYRPAGWTGVWTQDEASSVLAEQRGMLQRLGYIQ